MNSTKTTSWTVRKNLRTLAFAALASIASLLLTSCGGQKKNADFTFKIGTANSSLCPAPLHVAIDLGLFEEEFSKAGLKYEAIEIDLMQATSLVVAKKIDATFGLAGSLLPQLDNGLEVSFLTGVHTGCTKFYVRADSPYYSAADLKGKTIGLCGVQDSSTIVWQRKFHELGLTAYGPEADFKMAIYGLTDLPIALENKAVEAVGLHDPVGYLAEKQYGFRNILDTTSDPTFSQEYCCMTFVSSEVAKKYPEHTKAFVRAMLKASAFTQSQPYETARLQIENKHVSGDLEANAEMLKSYNYTPSVSLAYQTLFNAIDQVVDMGVMQNVADKQNFVDSHFVRYDDVPDSYVYSDGTYTEAKVTKLAQKL